MTEDDCRSEECATAASAAGCEVWQPLSSLVERERDESSADGRRETGRLEAARGVTLVPPTLNSGCEAGRKK